VFDEDDLDHLEVPLSPTFIVPLPTYGCRSYTGNKLDPTKKPVAVFTPLVQLLTKSVEFVLDPFGGSGSTLLSANLIPAVP
jgi:DNA modification methylase